MRMHHLVLWITFAVNSAYGQECADQYYLSLKIKSKSKCESHHMLSNGSGVVSPSTLATIGENPAGLAYNRQFKINASAREQSRGSQWEGSFASAGGNGIFGLGASLHQYSNSLNNASSQLYSIGAGNFLSKLKSSIGGSFRFNMNDRWRNTTVYPEMKSKYTVGSLINSTGNQRLGVVGHDIGTDDEFYSAGVSTDLNRSLFFVVDASAKSQFQKGVIKPALNFNWGNAQLSLGWNQPIASPLSDWTQSHFTFGLGIWEDDVKIVIYFNRVELYYIGLTVSF